MMRTAAGPARGSASSRRSFTLTELMVATAIIALFASLVLVGMQGAQEQAREARTRAQITKIHMALMDHWDSYRTRPVPVQIAPGTNPYLAGQRRLSGLRELMRMELPDRISDVVDPPVVLSTRPALSRAYQRRLGNWPVMEHQGAVCLYLILASMREGDRSVLDSFPSREIGYVDEDGGVHRNDDGRNNRPVILDAWGSPIEFLRWAPGYVPEVHSDLITMQTTDHTQAPDPFDPLKVDPRWGNDQSPIKPFALFPLVYSAGSDKQYHIATDNQSDPHRYAAVSNDPYTPLSNGAYIGEPDTSATGFMDNITNHFLEVR